MNRLAAGLALTLALGALPAASQDSRDARMSDVQRLSDDLDRLDDSLADLRPNHPRSREFNDRANRVRDDVVALRDEIQRNRRGRDDSLGVPYSEVERVHQSIASLRDEIDRASGLGRADSGRGLRIPEGTEIPVRLEDRLSSETSRPEDRFEATVARSVRVDGRVAIPAGTRVKGTVRNAEASERVAKGGHLDLDFDSLQLDDGTRIDMRSRVVRMSEGMDRSETGKKAGLGALLGGVLGGVIEGKKGALVGALVGGTGGVIASRGDEVVLPAGTMLTIQLDRPVVVATR